MSRHTLNDGTTPDPTITTNMFDEWLPILAPPAGLIGDYYKRGIAWEEFAQRYTEHIGEGEAYDTLARIARQAVRANVTVLCTETSSQYCHRRLLAEQAQIIIPTLVVVQA